MREVRAIGESKKTKSCHGLILVFVVVLMFGNLRFGEAHSPGVVLSAYGTMPTMNGVDFFPWFLRSFQDPLSCKSLGFAVCETNDDANMYFLILIMTDGTASSSSHGREDFISLLFDNEHDGGVPACGDGAEDMLGLRADSVFLDGTYCLDGNNLSIDVDGDFQGKGNVMLNEVGDSYYYFYEIWHPLNSGDVQDYALAPNSTVGFCLTFHDSVGAGDFDYPRGCIFHLYEGSAASYGDILIATRPATNASGPFDALKDERVLYYGGVAIVVVLVASATLYYINSRKRGRVPTELVM